MADDLPPGGAESRRRGEPGDRGRLDIREAAIATIARRSAAGVDDVEVRSTFSEATAKGATDLGWTFA